MSTALKKESARDVAGVGAERTRNRTCFQPRVDIFEQSGELVLIADMPGVKPEGIDIRFEKGVLTIFGKVEDRQTEGTRYLWSEYAVGDYHRTFQVSEVIDASGIAAEYTDGQLVLHLPKTAAAQPRKIEVQTR